MPESWLKGKKVEEVDYSGGTFDADGKKLTPSGGGGSVATDSIFTAKGDLPVGTGASTAVALAVGANDYILTADSTQTTGMKWAAAPSTGAPTDATYITQTANGTLSAEQALSSLATGMVKVTTGTGVLSTGTEGTDYYKPGGTDVAVADGGTGASTASAAATNLGLGTGNSPQFTGIELGHATDTTITRVSAGDIAVEGNSIYRAGGTDVAVADGGTGASDASTARTNLGTNILGAGVFGNGGDGTVTFDGSTTILGMAPSSSTYTLSRDFFFADCTINNSVSIITNGFRIFVSGTLTNNGTIKWDGAAGSGASGGAGVGNSSGSFNTNALGTNSASTSGGNGGATTGSAGTNGGANVNPTGGLGGAGGNGSSGNGGAGGTAATGTGTGLSSIKWLVPAIQAAYGTPAASKFIQGGTGGGGGGGDGVAGGGGGGGGGVVMVSARYISGTGTIAARGGNGANASGGNRAGGGGGGGGVVIVVSRSVSSGAVSGQTISVAGGTKGTSSGTATAAVDGGVGATVILES